MVGTHADPQSPWARFRQWRRYRRRLARLVRDARKKGVPLTASTIERLKSEAERGGE